MAGELTYKINPGKWAAIPVIFFIIIFACLIPHLLLKLKRGAALAIALATCLSGGAMLGIGLMHILPHGVEYWNQYFTPEGCSGGHEGHAHSMMQDVPEFTLRRINRDINGINNNDGNIIVENNNQNNRMTLLLNKLQLNDINTTFNMNEELEQYEFITNNDNNQDNNINQVELQKGFKSLQNIDPVDPETLIPTPIVEPDCPHIPHFSFAHLCCGLVIILLMGVESLLHAYLHKRGNDDVHLHSHGDGDHHHHHHHGHGHNHDDHHHKDGVDCNNTNDCSKEVIELSSAECQTPTSTTPTPEPSNDGNNNTNSKPIQQPDEENQHQHENDTNTQNNNDTDDSETSEQRRIREIIEGDDDLCEGHKLTEDEIQRIRFRRTVDAYVSAIAISLHCVFNGLSLGVFSASTQNDVSQFWTLFGATVGHKLMDGFSVGIPLMRANLKRVTTIIIAVLVAISTPVGIVIGYSASNVKNNGRYLSQAILMSLSAGSFFYIAMIELIPNGVKGRDWILLKWLCVCIGFAVSAVIAQWA